MSVRFMIRACWPGSLADDLRVVVAARVHGGDPPQVSAEAARGLGKVALRHGLPVAFGVLTTDDADQAMARAGGKYGNKGWEAAEAALEMIGFVDRVARA